jgi:hypothetical protein
MDWHDRHIEKLSTTQEEDFHHMYKERLFQMHIMEQRLIRHQELASTKYYKLLLKVLKHPQLNKFTNKKIPPPPPLVTVELTASEKLRMALELAKAMDCCQFYTAKYIEPKKDDRKKHDQQQLEQQQEPVQTTTEIAEVPQTTQPTT